MSQLTQEDRRYLTKLHREHGIEARGTKADAWMEILHRAKPYVSRDTFESYVEHAIDNYPGVGEAIGQAACDNPDGWESDLARRGFEGVEGFDSDCPSCLGSGIGQYGDPDTSRCGSCGGSGTLD